MSQDNITKDKFLNQVIVFLTHKELFQMSKLPYDPITILDTIIMLNKAIIYKNKGLDRLLEEIKVQDGNIGTIAFALYKQQLKEKSHEV